MANTRSTRGKKRRTVRRLPGLNPTTPQPPFLYEEFADGPPHAPPQIGQGSERGIIADVQKLYLLYKVGQGFAHGRVAAELEISESSSKRIVKKSEEDPEVFYLWGFITRWRVDSTVKYFCRYCAWIEKGKVEICVHAYSHLWDPDNLKIAPNPFLPRRRLR